MVASPSSRANSFSTRIDSFSNTIPAHLNSKRINHKPARRAMHEKTHKGPMRGQSTVLDAALTAVKAKLSEPRNDAAILVQVNFCLDASDIIKELEAGYVPALTGPVEYVGNKRMRKDGQFDPRCFNSGGATTRQGRSPQLKAKVIKEVIWLRDQYPEFSSESADHELVADTGSHNVSRNQVNAWLRNKDKIRLKDAKSRHDRKQLKDQRCRQGRSAFDPRSGSTFCGGISISSLYRRFIAAFPGPWIDDISTTYRRYIEDV